VKYEPLAPNGEMRTEIAMSNHDWTQENLDAYLAGGLTADERRSVELHIEACADCAQALAESRKLEQLMDDLFVEARPDAALEERAIAKLRRARITRASALRFVAAAAAVLVLGLVGAAVQAIAVDGAPFAVMGRAVSQNKLGSLRMATGLVDERTSKGEQDELGRDWDPELKHKTEGKEEVGVPGSVNPNDRLASTYSNQMHGYTRHGANAPRIDIPPVNSPPGVSMNNVKGGEKEEGEGLRKHGHTLGMELHYGDTSTGKWKASTETTWGLPPSRESSAKQEQIPAAVKKPDGEVLLALPMLPPDKSAAAYFKPAEFGKQDPSKTTPPPKDGKPGGGPPEGREEPRPAKAPATPQPEPQKSDPLADKGRKIIRTGVMEFEIDSFDAAVDKVNALIDAIKLKGGFVATVNSEKLPNGKVLGSVVVRMPPQLLDKFILDLRRELAKAGQLMSQRIGSQDVTKQYTDVESELRAARAVEERLIDIIKTKKGEIKDLIAAEAELGKWRTKIEKMEGEMRYYNNQISLSTLTITLVEKEILSPFAVVVTDHVRMRIEVEEVAKAHKAALTAVEEVKGRVTKSELKQHKAGQFEAILNAEVPPEKKDAFRDLLKKLGLVTEHEDTQRQQAIGGGGRPKEIKSRIDDVQFEVALNNIANIPPRHIVTMLIATKDVEGNFSKLQEAIRGTPKGQVRDAKINEQDKQNVNATIDFNVPIDQKPAIDNLIKEVGSVLTRSASQTPLTELATERKYGYILILRSVANIAPRETVTLKIEVKDVDKKVADVKDMVRAGQGRIANADVARQENGQVNAILTVDVPLAVADLLVRQIKESGNLLSQQTSRNPNVPENELATARIEVTLSGVFAGKLPREKVALRIEVEDVDKKVADMKELVRASKGRVADEKSGRHANGQSNALLVFEVPLSAQDALVQQFKAAGKLVSYDTARNPNVPENDLASAHITVTLVGANPIVPSDEGLGSYIRSSLYLSFRIFAYCVMAIILGLSAVVPICLVIFGGYVLVRWMWPGETSNPALVRSLKPATSTMKPDETGVKPEATAVKPAEGGEKSGENP
jgi:hypothetical protein